MLLPMFSYYGSKYQLAAKLTAPQRDHIIEPFAGSACYSLYYHNRYLKVTLIDADPVVAGVWDYLLHATARDIMALPVDVTRIEEVKACQEAQWLIGFWFNNGNAVPSKHRRKFGTEKQFWRSKSVWGESIRERLASQVEKIAHWKIIHGDWREAPDIEAHWHVDPPYCGTRAGKGYKFNKVDYEALAKWCLKRRGFVQVCESFGADWLPFEKFARTRGTPGRARSLKYKANHRQYSAEAVFEVGSRRWSLIRSSDFKEG